MDGAEGRRDDDVLVSDADRQQVIDLLRISVGEGRITLDEFADRVGEVWAARTSGELQSATRQLPVPAARPSLPNVPVQPQVSGRRVTRWTVAVMGGHERKGRWRVRGATNAFALMGGCKLDLRSAEVEGPEIVITAVAIMGGIDIIVPEGIAVELTGFALMGGKDARLADVPPIPGAPVVRVRGFALMGGIGVRSRKDPKEEAAERDRRRQARAERHDKQQERRERRMPPPLAPPHGLSEGGDPASAIPTMPVAPDVAPVAGVPPFPTPAAAGGPTGDAPYVQGMPGAARAPGIPVAPDGTVTILFTDIEGFTAMTQRLGDLRAREVLARHHDLVRRQVAACGGYEVKSQGDGFMVAFAGAAKALRCAIGIERAFDEDADANPDSPLKVRIGLHTGEAVRIDDDFYGSAVNMASRIASEASGGEVLVSSLLRELTEGSGEFAFGPGREVELKGFDGARTVYPLRW